MAGRVGDLSCWAALLTTLPRSGGHRALPRMTSDGDDLHAQESVDLSLGETGPD